LIIGEIAQVGGSYLVTLNAENCQTGESLAQEHARAGSQEEVLEALDLTATEMRKRLGESLASVERINTPLEQATTHSLEALKAYNKAGEMNGLQRKKEAIAFSQRAVDLDPNFASGHHFLSVNLWNNWQSDLAREPAARAFELRERATERERLLIEANYHSIVSYDFEKAVEVDLIGVETYPNAADFHNDLSVEYMLLGQWEEALGPAREAVRLWPEDLVMRTVLANIYVACGRFPEARATLEEVLGQGLESAPLHEALYRIARLEEDQRAMEIHLGWLKEHAAKEDVLRIAYTAEVLAGQFERARVSCDALVVSLLNQGNHRMPRWNSSPWLAPLR